MSSLRVMVFGAATRVEVQPSTTAAIPVGALGGPLQRYARATEPSASFHAPAVLVVPESTCQRLTASSSDAESQAIC